MRQLLLPLSALTMLLLLGAGPALAQVTHPTPPTTGAPEQERAISGALRTPRGPVVGASVRLVNSGQISVSNGDGEFYFRLPAPGPQPAIISYSGGDDMPVTLRPGRQPAILDLPDVHLTKKGARDLKRALKYGRRQGRKDSRKLR